MCSTLHKTPQARSPFRSPAFPPPPLKNRTICVAGRVIAHSQEKEAVVATGVQYRKQHPDVQLFLFYAGEKIPEGVVVLL